MDEVIRYTARMEFACAAGMDVDSSCSSPGPDFAKTPAQTVTMLHRLDAIAALGRPILLAA